jgi:hypothetical protein
MAFLRLYPVKSENNAMQRSQLLEPCLILTGHRRTHCEPDLAQSGDFCAGARKLCCAFPLSLKLGDRPVLAISPFPKTGDHLEPNSLSSQRA